MLILVNPIDSRIILALAGGDTEYHIEYRIELSSQCIASLKAGTGTFRNRGATIIDPDESHAHIAKFHDPAMQLLHSFGYATFDYTKDKDVIDPVSIPRFWPIQVNGIIVNGLVDHKDEPTERDPMYT